MSPMPASAGRPLRRQRSEHHTTRSQSRAHALRQANGRPQAGQVLVGSSPFLRILGMTLPVP